ncbi:sensor histidine kinase [Sulfurimonas sp.]|uniref:sensor histidine kinase n=1 Tax=Sulfurimonas sp. TaxID=2022749 RepID=UPI0039E548F9
MVLTIRDNAGGIAEDVIGKIFNPYFTTKEEGKGTGVGLYMSSQIVNNMNGSIEVENSELFTKNRGAKFTIKLPIC